MFKLVLYHSRHLYVRTVHLTTRELVFSGYKEGYLCHTTNIKWIFTGVKWIQCLDRFAVLWISLIIYSVRFYQRVDLLHFGLYPYLGTNSKVVQTL